MKRLFTILSLFIFSVTFAQNAQDYFPSDLGYVWFYKVNQLDSNNVPVEESSFWIRDSLSDITVCTDCNEAIILDAYGSEDIINYVPYMDTSLVKFQGSIASVYVDLTSLIDTLLFEDENFYNTLKALSGWYDLYHFNSAVGLEYQIFLKDTTIVVDDNEIPLRFEIKGARNSDETLETEIGSFNCKKFLITSTVYYLQSTPFGDIPIPLVTRENNVWIAPENWIVKEFAPTRTVDFSQIGGPTFTIPGTQKIIKTRPVGIDDETELPTKFVLRQNYPNPFNPTTTISYSIPSARSTVTAGTKFVVNVDLTVYNILGQKIATLLNENQAPGNYSVQFNAENLPSGIYFYTLRAGNFVETKKMILMK